MNKMLKRVKEMHEHFGISSEKVQFYDNEKNFRHACLEEEVIEYKDAKNLEDELDSLVDLLIFTIGTVERHGWLHIFEEAFNRVMDANMKKTLGPNNKRGSFAIDLQKPEGWKSPNLSDLVIKSVPSEPKTELTGIDKTLQERGSRYGKFEDNARITQEIMNVLMSAPNSDKLENMHKECLHMVSHKMARMVCGDPNYDDNPRDIAGYATGLMKYLEDKNDSED